MAAVLLLALANCSSQGKVERQARNEAEAAAIQAELAEVPGVTKVEVHYVNAITEPGGGTASVTVERGTDMEHVAELAVEAIWRSRLDPLNTISVGVGDGEGAIARDYIVDKEHPDDKTSDLEAKYGPRPFKTGS